MAFQGQFDFTLDAKNRLTIPSRYRDDFREGVVLAAGLEPCVAIWRPSKYDAWREQVLAGHNPLSREYRTLRRFFSASAFPTDLDGAGRVMVPGFLMEHAHLEREVSVVGADDCLEVWDRNRWSEYREDVLARAADIAQGLGA